MAAAVRMTLSGSDVGRLALVAAGDFGCRVAQLLAETCPGSRKFTAEALADAFAGDAAAITVVVPRPAWALCEHADKLAYRHGKPWLPVTMEHPVLRVGPLVRPPSGPCFACYRARRFQHDTNYASSTVLNAAYDADAALSPAGYLPQHARLAAAVVTRFLAAGQTGQVVTFDLLSWRGGVHRVVSCHDCARENHPGGRKWLDLAGIAAQVAVGS